MDFDKSINTPAPIESLNNQSHFENPWAVEDGLEHFLNYCCPECEMKSASRELFLQHAINQHPLVKECLHLLTGVKDESFLDDDDIMDSADPIKYEDEEEEDVKPKLIDLDPTQMLKVEVDAENGNPINKPKRRRKCPHCLKISKNLAKHKCKIENDDDEEEKEFPCTHEGCEQKFKSEATRTTHRNKVHGRPKPFKCDVCEEKFESGRAVAKHFAEEHPGQKMSFPCSMCDKSYSSKMILKGHMKYVHQGIRFKCDQCDKEYHKRTRLAQHVRIVHEGGDKIPCEICGKKFTDKNTLKNHKIKIHIGDKVWQCDKCDQSFKYRNTFQMHVAKVHEGGLPYPCDSCDMAFLDEDKLNSHKKTVHEGIYDHFCEYCGKAFSNIYRLKAHLISVHGGKSGDCRTFDCVECDQKFQYNYLLREHIQAVHEGIKFQCPECGKEYNKRQTDMKRHIECVHEGRRDHHCHLCGKQFGIASALKRHIEVHEGIKRHKCKFCEQAFGSHTGRKKHMRRIHPTLFVEKVYRGQGCRTFIPIDQSNKNLPDSTDS